MEGNCHFHDAATAFPGTAVRQTHDILGWGRWLEKENVLPIPRMKLPNPQLSRS